MVAQQRTRAEAEVGGIGDRSPIAEHLDGLVEGAHLQVVQVNDEIAGHQPSLVVLSAYDGGC